MTSSLLNPSLRRTLILAFGLGVALTTRAAEPPPSQNPTINLVRLLVIQKVITQEQADVLIAQAEAQAAQAVQAAQLAAAPVPAGAPAPDGTVRVQYVPESVKKELREDVRQAVLWQTRTENWAAPNAVPEWVKRIRLLGDLRFRYENLSYADDNTTAATNYASHFWNFNAINTGSAFDQSLRSGNPPFVNTDQDRTRLRFRARFGAEIDLGEDFTAGFRLASGETSSPTTANQTFGSGGGFSKYAVWIDRAFLTYELKGVPETDVSFSAGRFDNPFFSTNLIWSEDLGFDGLLAKARFGADRAFSPFFTTGLFPVYNTELNFASTSPEKFKSQDKWLYGAQLGATWKANDELTVKFGAAYYGFQNIQGQVSRPLATADVPGDTDWSRPSFAQRGNTYIGLRDNQYIYAPGDSNYGKNYQYFGLAAPFRELAFTARVDYTHFDPFNLWLDVEVVKNLAFNRSDVDARGPISFSGPVNNLNKDSLDYDGGGLGWLVRLNVGSVALAKRWDWNVSLGYKYVESDAVVDGFTDSDFGGGGTNLKGYTLGASLALSKRVWTRLRWQSADSIAGPGFGVDSLQLDLNAKF